MDFDIPPKMARDNLMKNEGIDENEETGKVEINEESKQGREDGNGNEEYGYEYYDEEDEVQEVDKDVM